MTTEDQWEKDWADACKEYPEPIDSRLIVAFKDKYPFIKDSKIVYLFQLYNEGIMYETLKNYDQEMIGKMRKDMADIIALMKTLDKHS